jgi:aspartate/methionine/tyrosine aminotransferase
MIPIPQYPLYSASIALYGGSQVNYYLNEETNWGLDIKELERSYKEAEKNGINVRALSVINPGNPTGQLLSEENMANVVEFCEKKKLILLADEVYQENVYTDEKNWHSFNKIVETMGKKDTFDLISFHSCSKGFLGECGRRGGWFQMSPSFTKEIYDQVYKHSSVSLCPNVDGQVLVECKVSPPKKGDPSFEDYEREKLAITESLKKRAKKVEQSFNSVEGVSCRDVEGAMYAFPKIVLPKKAVEEAKKLGKSPDLFYCLHLLNETGMCVVPGSGFGQKEGTFHFRTTFLPPEDQIDKVITNFKNFHEKFINKYQ